MFVLVLLIATLLLTSCSEEGSIIPDDAAGINEATIEAETSLTGISPADMELISGYSTSTEDITLSAGMLIVEGKSDGGLFSVNLVQDGANELLFNETKKFHGSTAIKVRDASGSGFSRLGPGPAKLEVISSGDWSISHTQKELGVTHPPDFSIAGYQDFVLPGVNLSAGSHVLKATNDEEYGHFSVNLIPVDGDGGLLVINGANHRANRMSSKSKALRTTSTLQESGRSLSAVPGTGHLS